MSSSNQQKLIEKTTPQLCIKCHQMYGHETFANMCSKCFKLQKLQTQQQAEKKNTIQQSLQTKQQKFIEQEQIPQKVQQNQQSIPIRRETNTNNENKSERQRTRQKEQKKAINKCFTCSKKTGMLGHQCKHCSNLFCKFHRLPEDHQCGVDFITQGKKILTAAFPELKPRKVSGIDNDN